ncbi:MAG: Gfo/Idh/MocA family oxidoreductase [Candidatus Latescibacteria bacterium]|nr:Gfo/Idh/MocA family oxidoreductase [Candidatus Latescibacterota bacterium]
MKKIGLMGCGTVANYGHAPSLQSTDGLVLHALFDPSEQNLRSTQGKFDVPNAFTDVEAFFDSGIDAVAITSPATFHCQNVLDAARRGKHILCEKPLAMTDGEAEEMIRAANDAGVMLFTGLDYRFSSVSQTIRKVVQEGGIGAVRSLRLIYIWNNHGKSIKGDDGQMQANARRDFRMIEGGPMVDCGVHQIDLARWWLNSEVIDFRAEGVWVDEYEAPDHMYVHLDHENGAHTMVEMSYSYCYTAKEPIAHFTYQLIGTDGLIRFDREQKIFEVRNTEGTQPLPFAGEKNFKGMYDAFSEALQTGGSDVLPTGEDGRIATHIARTATEQAMAARR